MIDQSGISQAYCGPRPVNYKYTTQGFPRRQMGYLHPKAETTILLKNIYFKLKEN